MDQIINDNGKRSIDLVNIRKKRNQKLLNMNQTH
uniref:Uncharacterized protein n=1 Tax=Moumouvirus sp. 'Monve' TaxID=1128131 RepID=H2EDD9_9VIRU|nr:hypothetical protein mv_L207 [Moumouvirus Monve]